MIRYHYGTGSDLDQKVSEFIRDHGSGTIFHEPVLNQIVSKHFNTDFFYLMLTSGDQITGLCPMHRKNKVFYSAPRHFDMVYGGFLLSDTKALASVLKNLDIKPYQSLAEYWTFPDINKELDPAFFKQKAETAIIDLDQDYEEIFKNVISSNRRNMIRKAIKNNIKIEMGGSELLERFLAMLRVTYSQAGLKTRPETFYRDILDYYFPHRQAVCMIAGQDGTDLAGIVILRNRLLSSYWLGVSSGEKLNLGASELLQSEAIQWSMENKSRYYDLCVIDKNRLPSIARFKLGFSDRTVPFYFTNRKPLVFRILNKLDRI